LYVPKPTRAKDRRKRSQEGENPDLLERVIGMGCTRLAVVSLHAGAGARTVVEALSAEAPGRGVDIGVTSIPRIDTVAEHADRVTGVTLPQGAIVATAASVVDDAPTLEPLERIDCTTPLGELCVCRVTESSEVPVYGPDDGPMLGAALDRLEARTQGLVMVNGAWERHGFAAPDVTRAVVLAVGSTYSGEPQRSAAAVRYTVEMLGLPRHTVPLDRVWREAADRGRRQAVDRNGQQLGEFPEDDADRAFALESLGSDLEALVVPGFLSDSLLSSLVRSQVCCTLVVKDASRVRVSPVYYTAWTKKGGQVAVIEPTNLIAVASNPTNPNGPDADAADFRRLVSEAVPEVAVHDVVLEAEEEPERPKWKFWG
jgi:hypothetical protein